MHIEKNDQLYSLNTLETIHSKICGYLNGRKLLFQNTLPESMRSRAPSTDEICTATLFPNFPIIRDKLS